MTESNKSDVVQDEINSDHIRKAKITTMPNDRTGKQTEALTVKTRALLLVRTFSVINIHKNLATTKK